MPSPPASRLGDDAPDDESGASSAGPGAFGPPGRKSVGTPLAGKSPNVVAQLPPAPLPADEPPPHIATATEAGGGAERAPAAHPGPIHGPVGAATTMSIIDTLYSTSRHMQLSLR